jgi:hypothetical protein
MGILDSLLGSQVENFRLRDYRNASHLRPDVNPPRQQFQGYVNFILNKDLFGFLFADNGSTQFRTQISSLVRTADLPSVTFKTEIKNKWNAKKIINTGVEYQPVNMTVFDTMGNEWLSTLMKYFSYYYMDPRNKQEVGNRDIEGSVPRVGGVANLSTAFGLNGITGPIAGQRGFDSNAAGYNPQQSPNFFERIDYVLYHGNKGVQYSIINPMLTTFKPGSIDYSSSQPMEFQMSFDYERFTVYNVLNFDLSEEDVDRFENTDGVTFVDALQNVTLPTVMQQSREILTLGNTASRPDRMPRAANPNDPSLKPPPPPPADDDSDEAAGPPAPPPPPQPTVLDREGRTPEGLQQQYGAAATFGGNADNDPSGLFGVLDNVFTSGINAVLTGSSVKDAVAGAAAVSIGTFIGKEANKVINGQGDDT